jgi:hypothetical protein
MDDTRPFQHRPADFKTEMDGLGGLVRIPLQGGLHDGRELYIDEPEVPRDIWTTPNREPFEWWPERLRDEISRTALGNDPESPPIHYILDVDEETLEPRYVVEGAPD